MIANATVEILAGTLSADAWGDSVVTEAAPVVAYCHISPGTRVVDRDGVVAERCRIRIPSDVTVGANSVLRVNGVRWKPVSTSVSLFPQRFAVYNCQRIS